MGLGSGVGSGAGVLWEAGAAAPCTSVSRCWRISGSLENSEWAGESLSREAVFWGSASECQRQTMISRLGRRERRLAYRERAWSMAKGGRAEMQTTSGLAAATQSRVRA